MKTTDCNVTPKCPHCGVVYVEGESFKEHVDTCRANPKAREAQRAYERNLAELFDRGGGR